MENTFPKFTMHLRIVLSGCSLSRAILELIGLSSLLSTDLRAQKFPYQLVVGPL
jgi:hypothetical protein